MTNIKMQYKWLPTAPGVCSRCVCVCTLDGLNAEHKFRVSLSLSVALYTVKTIFFFLNESVLILIRIFIIVSLLKGSRFLYLSHNKLYTV